MPSNRLTHPLYRHERRLIAGMWLTVLAAAGLVWFYPDWWTGALIGYTFAVAARCTYLTFFT